MDEEDERARRNQEHQATTEADKRDASPGEVLPSHAGAENEQVDIKPDGDAKPSDDSYQPQNLAGRVVQGLLREPLVTVTTLLFFATFGLVIVGALQYGSLHHANKLAQGADAISRQAAAAAVEAANAAAATAASTKQIAAATAELATLNKETVELTQRAYVDVTIFAAQLEPGPGVIAEVHVGNTGISQASDLHFQTRLRVSSSATVQPGASASKVVEYDDTLSAPFLIPHGVQSFVVAHVFGANPIVAPGAWALITVKMSYSDVFNHHHSISRCQESRIGDTTWEPRQCPDEPATSE